MFEHFIEAQADTYEKALSELRAGRKRSHWMWFIFPQIAGLGHSPMSLRFAIKDEHQARAYLDHPVLGARLRDGITAVLPHAKTSTAQEIFGSPDDLKFRSSLTLFAHAAPTELLFQQALQAFYDGEEDELTVRFLRG